MFRLEVDRFFKILSNPSTFTSHFTFTSIALSLNPFFRDLLLVPVLQCIINLCRIYQGRPSIVASLESESYCPPNFTILFTLFHHCLWLVRILFTCYILPQGDHWRDSWEAHPCLIFCLSLPSTSISSIIQPFRIYTNNHSFCWPI